MCEVREVGRRVGAGGETGERQDEQVRAGEGGFLERARERGRAGWLWVCVWQRSGVEARSLKK